MADAEPSSKVAVKKGEEEIDYTLNNPDTLTKYRTAADIAHKVLGLVTDLVKDGATILSICEEGDRLLIEETDKVFKGKKMVKGMAFPTTISPNDILTPLSPSPSDPLTENLKVSTGDVIKLQLGAQIDGFAAVVGSTFVVSADGGADDTVTGDKADLLLATHYCHEAFLRLLMVPQEVEPKEGEEKAKVEKQATQQRITSVLNKIASSYGCTVVESTTSYLFGHKDIEGKKRYVAAPGEGQKGEGLSEVSEVWGVEVQLSLGSGKVKSLPHKPTLYRKTTTTFALKRPTSRQTLTEVTKRFGNFVFSSRQLSDAKTASFGLLECTRNNVLRQYEVLGEKDGKVTSREFGVVAVTKKGITRLTTPPTIDLEKVTSDKKVEDAEIIALLELPLGPVKKANKKKGKKAAGAAEE